MNTIECILVSPTIATFLMLIITPFINMIIIMMRYVQ